MPALLIRHISSTATWHALVEVFLSKITKAFVHDHVMDETFVSFLNERNDLQQINIT